MDSKEPLFDPTFVANELTPVDITIRVGDMLFKEGESNDFVFFVVSGSVKVSRNNWVIGITQPHEFVGITSCLSDKNYYTFSAIALEAGNVYRIRKEAFKNLLLRNPTFSKYIIEILCERIKLIDLKTSTFLNFPPERRVIMEILNNLKYFQGHLISQLSMKDLSELTGVSMKVVKRLIDNFIKDNIISMQQANYLILLDKSKLENILGTA